MGGWTSVLVGRGVTFALVAAFVTLGPAYRQVFGGSSEVVRAWRMFRGNSVGVCEVRYTRGDGEPVDRFAVLGHPVRAEAPRELRRLTERSLPATSGQLCRALGPRADLRVHARCATQKGWVEREDGQRNVCRP